jgi:FkbM family methyltransferase
MGYSRLLNQVARYYFMNMPVNDGKKQLLALLKNRITPPENIVTFKTRHGFYLKVNLKATGEERIYFFGEHDERYEIRNISKIIREGDVCWDIGAHIGFYTCLFASLVGPEGKVISFEPASTAVNCLRANVEINKYKNVTIVKKAISDKKMQGTLYYSTHDIADGLANLVNSYNRNLSESVEVDSIDNLCTELPEPDFIKIDVEGKCRELFRGGEVFFRNREPIIMAEIKDEDKNIVTEIEQFLRSVNYSIYEIGKRGFVPCLDLAHSRKRNFLLVKESSCQYERIREMVQR